MKDYRELEVWQKSVALAAAVYRVTRCFPKEEIYGLTAQVRRATVSIAANIAEGAGRWGAAEYRHFLSISRGSVAEVTTLLEVARTLGYVTGEQLRPLIEELDSVDRMLYALHRNLGKTAK